MKKAIIIDKDSKASRLIRDSKDKKSQRNNESIKIGRDQEILRAERNMKRSRKIEKEAENLNKKENIGKDHMIPIHSQMWKDKDQNLLQSQEN